MTTKKAWYPFRGIDLEIRFRGSPKKWVRGKVVSWTKFRFQFLRNDRKRPMWYLEEEIWGIKIVHRRPRNEEEL